MLKEIKKSMDALLKAYEAVKKEGKGGLPDEFDFLLDPAFQEKLETIANSADKIMYAAQILGQTAEEEVDESKLDELTAQMQKEGLLGGKGEEPVDGEKEEGEIEEGTPKEGKPPVEGEEPAIDEQDEEMSSSDVPPMAAKAAQATASGGDAGADKVKMARKIARAIEYILSDEE